MPEHAALEKLRASGGHPAELAALRRRLDQLHDGADGRLPGRVLEPVPDLPRLHDLPLPGPARAAEVLDQLAVIKLNGGLGTSMGLARPKSLLEVKPGRTFLDVLVTQVLALRERYGARLPLTVMNSAATRGPSLERLCRAMGRHRQDVPLDFLQGKEPKLRVDTGEPVEWPAHPELEWCPPGHGDLYTALAATGMLQTLLDAGIRWCFVSNSDNIGALTDVRMAAWVADEGVPFALEAVRGTPSDRKGGHLALHDGRILVRETAQVPDGDASFVDIDRWRYYNTNNLWIDLRVLRELQATDPAAPHLPLIVNRKTVDPRDRTSTPVIQLETAMGAALGSIPGARAVEVPRARFAPVKTTNDLLVIRSDAYSIERDGRALPCFDGPGPLVDLDDAHYTFLSDFEARFGEGAPSLRRCSRLHVDGDVAFGADVVIEGDVHLTGPARIAGGTVLRG